MTQTERIIKAMLRGYCSTKDLIEASGSLTPLARLAEWRNANAEFILYGAGIYPFEIYCIHGKDYEERIREKTILTRDGVKTKIIERRFCRVK